jgi:hypothetical protein
LLRSRRLRRLRLRLWIILRRQLRLYPELVSGIIVRRRMRFVRRRMRLGRRVWRLRCGDMLDGLWGVFGRLLRELRDTLLLCATGVWISGVC